MVAEQENVEVHDPTSQAKHKEYDRSDVEHVVGLRDWRDWDELLDWLRQEGDDDNELTPGEVRNLAQDVEAAKQRGAQFDANTDSVWSELQRA